MLSVIIAKLCRQQVSLHSFFLSTAGVYEKSIYHLIDLTFALV